VVEALLPREGPFRDGARAAMAAGTAGGAFLAGYRSAVRAAFGVADGALAATEDGPLHPARIATTLRDGRVTGRKSFLTGVPGAVALVVLAREGSAGDRAILRVVVVPVDAPGVTVTPSPPLPFAPDVPHAAASFVDAPVARALPGDGWAEGVRPFRTVEDVHALGALAAWLLAAAPRAGFSAASVEGLAASLAALSALSTADPASPATHLALAGVIAAAERAWPELSLPDPAAQSAWRRDQALLAVARRARAARAEAAAEAFRRGS
jgi:acyl-CoA dehydrogenase